MTRETQTNSCRPSQVRTSPATNGHKSTPSRSLSGGRRFFLELATPFYVCGESEGIAFSDKVADSAIRVGLARPSTGVHAGGRFSFSDDQPVFSGGVCSRSGPSARTSLGRPNPPFTEVDTGVQTVRCKGYGWLRLLTEAFRGRAVLFSLAAMAYEPAILAEWKHRCL